MADEKNPDLSTDSKKVEYFNQKVEDLKEQKPDISDTPPAAFDIAKSYSLQGIFPPFGFISFNEEPGKVKDQKFIDDAAEAVVFGSAKFIRSLKSDPPEALIQKGIDTFGDFERSQAVSSLSESTRVSFVTIKQGLQEIKESVDGGDQNPENPFENTPLKKLNTDELSSLIDSTIIKFIREIGLKREDESRDKTFLDKADVAFSKISTEAVVTPTRTQAEEQRLRAQQEEDNISLSLLTSKTGGRIVTENPTPAPTAETNQIENQISTPTTPTTPTATTQPSALVTINESNLNLEREVETPAAPTSPTQQPPTLPETAQASASQVAGAPTEAQTTDFKDNPLLMKFGEALGFNESDMAEVFGGTGVTQIAAGIASPTASVTAEGTASVRGSQENIRTTEGSTANKVTEPVKMATPTVERTTTVTPPPPPPAATTEKTEVSETTGKTGEGTPETPPTQGGSGNETKPQGETIKEEDTTNAELLKVMKDILRTLQGPLITTDGTHKFH